MPEKPPTVPPRKALNHHISDREGTVSFNLTHRELFAPADSDGTHVIVNANGTTQTGVEVNVQVYRDNGENDLVYEYTQVDSNGGSRRQCRVSLDDWRFSEFDEYLVFLVWSTTESRLHIGPLADDDDKRELRTGVWTRDGAG